MLKGAWILPAVMLVALIIAALVPAEASAAGRSEFTVSPKTFFKDLPGVKPQEQRVEKSEYSCTTGIADVYIGRGSYDILYGDTMPRRVYQCKTDSGVTYTGTEMPNTQWVPGLNPRHLPK